MRRHKNAETLSESVADDSQIEALADEPVEQEEAPADEEAQNAETPGESVAAKVPVKKPAPKKRKKTNNK